MWTGQSNAKAVPSPVLGSNREKNIAKNF